MQLKDTRYKQFALCREMFETVNVIRNADPDMARKYLPALTKKKKLLLTGEGSSRLFPAKHCIYLNLIRNCGFDIFTESSTQALEYNLEDFAVFAVSNSGKTKELVKLLTKLNEIDHEAVFGIVANQHTPVQLLTHSSSLLSCGAENAVAATKSVMEQALFYHCLYLNLMGERAEGLDILADQLRLTLESSIDPYIIKKLINAPVIYFAGRNNGVAEEITLKANEIAHKPSGYLEGTYAVHGIEESLNKEDVVVVFDPFESEEDKFREVLIKGVGVEVIAIATRPTPFATILVPDAGPYQNYIELAMGWNLLVETGLGLGLNIDKPSHARKIGNEYLQTNS